MGDCANCLAREAKVVFGSHHIVSYAPISLNGDTARSVGFESSNVSCPVIRLSEAYAIQLISPDTLPLYYHRSCL